MFGYPTRLQPDQGTSFTAQATQQWAQFYDTYWTFQAPYHPQVKSATERWNGRLLQLKEHKKWLLVGQYPCLTRAVRTLRGKKREVSATHTLQRKGHMALQHVLGNRELEWGGGPRSCLIRLYLRNPSSVHPNTSFHFSLSNVLPKDGLWSTQQ